MKKAKKDIAVETDQLEMNLSEKIQTKPAHPEQKEKLFNVTEQLLEWAASLPEWQSDALRRCIVNSELTESDVKEVLELIKTDQKIITTPSVTAKPLTEQEMPTKTKDSPGIILDSMNNFKNVNALVPDQTLKFEKTGITIIYGHNASGKSGYARVLKKACRARGERKRILPDVFDAGKPKGPAQVDINVILDGENAAQKITWVDETPPNKLLTDVSVFDSMCARVYVDDKNNVAYVPYGLDVFDKLSKLFEKIKEELKKEIDGMDLNREALDGLFDAGTKVGKIVEALSHETSAETIEKLATLSEEERLQLIELEKKIAELTINDPIRKAESLRLMKRRIEKFSQQLDGVQKYFLQASIDEVKKRDRDYDSAVKVAELAANKSEITEPLNGVMTEPWKIMFLAAKDYSEKQAYPGKQFPFTGDESRCVLCFSPLSDETADRLKRFQKYIEGKTQQVLKNSKEAFEKSKKAYEELNVNPLKEKVVNAGLEESQPQNLESEFIAEIEKINSGAAKAVQADIRNMEELHSKIIDSLSNKNWDGIVPPTITSIEKLKLLAADLERQAVEFTKISESSGRAEIESEHKELKDRNQLVSKKEIVLRIIKNSKLVDELKKVSKLLNTAHISRKSGEIMEQVVTEKLKANLVEEFKRLKIDYLKLQLNKAGQAGVVFHQLKLQSKTHSEVSVSDVLSEGEQRAIAIASFLAELNTSHTNRSIVFDDPVSSLDHMRREFVATRLVEEGKNRQVIIFTHDLVFFVALQTLANQHGVGCFVQTVWGNPTGSGYCDPEAPWKGQNVKNRIGYLKKRLQERVRKAYQENPNGESYALLVKDYFEKIRETWERTIEELVFNDTVQRFRDGVDLYPEN